MVSKVLQELLAKKAAEIKPDPYLEGIQNRDKPVETVAMPVTPAPTPPQVAPVVPAEPPPMSAMDRLRMAKKPTPVNVVERLVPVSALKRLAPQANKPVGEKPQPQATQTAIEIPVMDVANSADIESLRKNLNYLAQNIDQKEVVGQVLRTTAQMLQRNKALGAVMEYRDYDLLITALRSSSNIAMRTKQETKGKRNAKAQVGDELKQMFKDTGLLDSFS